MADYWKSQPRKFCQYCKCWIADNKPSVEFHERGKNHKENVAAKISEIKKKSVDKAKQEARMSKEFAAMEEAALKAYEEDLKRMERESAGLPAQIPTPPQPQPPVKPPIVINKTRHQAKIQKKQEKEKKKLRAQKEAQTWVEGRTEDGHAYYYNSLTGESKWEKPEGFQGANPAPAQPGQTESSSGCPWKEAVSPDGYRYYYNSETGETSWEEPAGFPIEPPGTAPYKGREIQMEPSTTPLEPPPGEEEKSSVPPVSHQAEAPEQESLQPKTPKISFRKRKSGEPSVKEREAKVSDDSPKGEAEEMKKKEEVQSATAEPEEKKVEAAPVRKQARRAKTTNPYGRWEKIQEEVDPYAKVDLQLPKVEGIIASSAPADIPPEPKPKFKERIITSLGVEGGPASFRKNKTQNGKSRSIRQRDDDDE
ncbi:WW domain-binding protein 4 [Pungitius pungitius]|uniref:WW domain-binding protein 4 n=1 Tax=Pungitius pungitius TaxID=134920 RepID=UPI00188905C2|nr:WW domain-binding protein 4 [Pungitius pungitius]